MTSVIEFFESITLPDASNFANVMLALIAFVSALVAIPKWLEERRLAQITRWLTRFGEMLPGEPDAIGKALGLASRNERELDENLQFYIMLLYDLPLDPLEKLRRVERVSFHSGKTFGDRKAVENQLSEILKKRSKSSPTAPN